MVKKNFIEVQAAHIQVIIIFENLLNLNFALQQKHIHSCETGEEFWKYSL